MFAIAVPSTITLTTPADSPDDPPVPYATLSFLHPTDDVSKCRVRLETVDGDVHEATFNTNGGVVDRYFSNAEMREQEAADAAEAAKEGEAEQKRQQWEAEAQKDKELLTKDDTTAEDVTWDAPHDRTLPTGAIFDPTPPPEHNPFEAPPAPSVSRRNVGTRPVEPFQRNGDV